MDNKYSLNTIVKVLEKLFSIGFNDEKSILKMQMSDIKKINGGLSSQEMMIVIDLQEAIRSKQIIPFLSGRKDKNEKE